MLSTMNGMSSVCGLGADFVMATSRPGKKTLNSLGRKPMHIGDQVEWHNERAEILLKDGKTAEAAVEARLASNIIGKNSHHFGRR